MGLISDIGDAGRELRARVLSSPRFQRWAARFPATRAIARSRAAGLFDLCAGFVYSQVLFACVRLRVLEAVRERPRTVDEIAALTDLTADAARRLLDAATALRLLEPRTHGRYGLGAHGASYCGNPQLAAMIEHHALLYRDLADPVSLLRGENGETELRRFWSYDGGDVTGYSELMAASLALLAEDVLEAYPFAEHARVLDLGGGQGELVARIAERHPRLELTLVDLPPVAERARDRLARRGLSGRVRVLGGDALDGPVPGPVDLVTLVRVLHDHDDADALRILKTAARALAPGGSLLVAEPMSGTDGAEPVGDAYFGFYLLAMGQGRPRHPHALERLLARAGFVEARLHSTRRPLLARVMSARLAEPVAP